MIVKITKWLQFVIFVVVLLFCCLVVLLALMTVRNHKIVQPTKQPNNQITKFNKTFHWLSHDLRLLFVIFVVF